MEVKDNIQSIIMIANAMFMADNAYTQSHNTVKRTPSNGNPKRVMHSLVLCGVYDPDVLCAALLHDTVEYTNLTIPEIRRVLGERVANIVSDITIDIKIARLNTIKKVSNKKRQIKYVDELSQEARLIKLAIMLVNLKEIFVSPPNHWTREDVQGHFAWSKAVVDAGLRGICPPLEKEIDALWERKISAPHILAEPFVALPDTSSEFLEAYYKRIEAAE